MIAGIARLIVVEAKGMILILNMAENESFPVTGGEAGFVGVTNWSSERLCSLMLLHYESNTIFTDATISKRFDWWTEVIDVSDRVPPQPSSKMPSVKAPRPISDRISE